MPKTPGEDLFMGFRLIETNNGEIKGNPARVWGMGIDPDDGVPTIHYDSRTIATRALEIIEIGKTLLPELKERGNNCLLIGIKDDVYLVDDTGFDTISYYAKAMHKVRDSRCLINVVKGYRFINGRNGKSNILFEV